MDGGGGRCGLAGFGTMQIYLPDRQFHGCIDFHATAPGGCIEDMWADDVEGETWDGFGFFIKGKRNEIGHQSVAVPGTIKGLHEAAAEYGTMPWARLIQPAIDVADRGAKVRPSHVKWWESGMGPGTGRVEEEDKLAFTPTGRAVYFDEQSGNLRAVGDVWAAGLFSPDFLDGVAVAAVVRAAEAAAVCAS